MNLQEMLNVVEQKSGRQLNEEQKAVITHGTGPLWAIAGPGSGKSEVLGCVYIFLELYKS